jgi:hypothetical protein
MTRRRVAVCLPLVMLLACMGGWLVWSRPPISEAERAFWRLRIGMTEAEALGAIGEVVLEPPYRKNLYRVGPECGLPSSGWPDWPDCAASGMKREMWTLVGDHVLHALFDRDGKLVGHCLLEPLRWCWCCGRRARSSRRP